MIHLFEKTTLKCSKIITQTYSTSFTLGIKMLDKSIQPPIYSIYGFVRYADEIVDTFHEFDKEKLLEKFEEDTYQAISQKISLNPVLHSFQIVVNKYNIDLELIKAFLHSMKMDLNLTNYDTNLYKEYIYGSAEVVGLMCLKVFCNGDKDKYDSLLPEAKSLGAAFQKVNFLRDMKSDYLERGRTYFPEVNFNFFDYDTKLSIEKDIEKDFKEAKEGIKRLPSSAQLGVYIAYRYYVKLFKKIKRTKPEKVMSTRIRINDIKKLYLLVLTYLQTKLSHNI